MKPNSQLEALAIDHQRELHRTRAHRGPRRQTLFARLTGRGGSTI